MNQELADFIASLFKRSGIPLKAITDPCDDWSWLDHGLRTSVLGVANEDFNQRISQRISSFEDRTVYCLCDVFQCSYTCAKLPNGRGTLFIGPLLFERVTDHRFDELFQKLGLPETMRAPLQNYYYGVCFFPYQAMYDSLITLIADQIYGKDLYRMEYDSANALDEWHQFYQGYWRIPNEPFMNIRFIEERYEIENALMQAVTIGNEKVALELGDRFQTVMLPQRLANALRDRKDYTITLNTILRKAAEQGGVHPIHIDNLSNSNIVEIEQLASIEQCKHFQHKLIQKYCKLVQEYSLQNYSLPIQKVLTYIRTDLTADLSLKSMAEKLSVNASYLSSLFKKEMGIPLTEYVNTCRISHAQLLLLSTNLPTKSIALQCGISDIYYFNRMFKRITGVTPKTYREKGLFENQEIFGVLPDSQSGKVNP